MVETDVTLEASVGSMVATVMERLGRIDNLVNNSGVGGPSGSVSGRSTPTSGGPPSK